MYKTVSEYTIHKQQPTTSTELQAPDFEQTYT